MFRLTDGHCPLLSSDGLCRVQLSLGEEALCDTCRAHPRFYEEYGAAKELTLSISCPAAIDLLFAQETPIKFVCREDGAPVSGCNDLDPDRYFALRRARDTAISITQNRALPISDRLSLLLLFSVRLQKLIDTEAYGRLDGLLARSCPREAHAIEALRFLPLLDAPQQYGAPDTGVSPDAGLAVNAAPAARVRPGF